MYQGRGGASSETIECRQERGRFTGNSRPDATQKALKVTDTSQRPPHTNNSQRVAVVTVVLISAPLFSSHASHSLTISCPGTLYSPSCRALIQPLGRGLFCPGRFLLFSPQPCSLLAIMSSLPASASLSLLCLLLCVWSVLNINVPEKLRSHSSLCLLLKV